MLEKTLKIYDEFIVIKDNMTLIIPFKRINKKKINKMFNDLFDELENTLPKRYWKKFYKLWIKNSKKYTFKNEFYKLCPNVGTIKGSIYESFVDSLYYYSDRWCYERYKTIQAIWNQLIKGE